MNSEIKVSFVIPLFNEEAVFDRLIERLSSFSEKLVIPHEMILVDDGSRDNTPELMQQLGLSNPKYHCIFFSRNFGHQYAVSAGLNFARGSEGVMILDGDLQDPPEIFEQFYTLLKNGYDVVYGVRTKRKESRLKKFSYYFFYRLLSRISTTPIFADSGDFSLISRRAVNIISSMPESSRFLRGMRSWIGFKQMGVEYEREKRVAGSTKYTWRKLFRLAYDGIFNFSHFPIKFLTWSGFFCLAVSIIYLLFTIYRRIFENDVPTGFTALLFMIIFFGGIQLISIGIIGEYVFRTFLQVKNRPMYIISSRIQNGSVQNETN